MYVHGGMLWAISQILAKLVRRYLKIKYLSPNVWSWGRYLGIIKELLLDNVHAYKNNVGTLCLDAYMFGQCTAMMNDEYKLHKQMERGVLLMSTDHSCIISSRVSLDMQ